MPRGRIYKHPTKPLHINVPLDLHALLMEFAELSGTPASRFITSTLVDNQAVLQTLVDALRQVKAGAANPLEGLNRQLVERINAAAALQSEVQHLSQPKDDTESKS